MNNDHSAYSAHRLTLEGRERLTISGVEDVERFDETGIVMTTAAGVLTVTGALLVGESVLSVDGDLTLAATAAVDFAGRAGLDLQAGEPVAVVSGAATLPGSAKTLNAGKVQRVSFVRDGTVIYALKTSGGTTIMIR